MTFCIGICVEEGLVALADTRIVKGSEILVKSKLSSHAVGPHPYFTMTSGLRSVRDKVLIYVDEAVAQSNPAPSRLYQIANFIGAQLRRAQREDGAALASAQLRFNTFAILGGQLRDDRQPTLFLIYPEGNWIEANPDSPYFVIGRTFYGSPFLARHLRRETALDDAAKWALMALDLTATSACDVAFPIDVALLPRGESALRRRRYEQDELSAVAAAWHAGIARSISGLPADWIPSGSSQSSR